MTGDARGLSQLVHQVLENYIQTVDDPQKINNLLETVTQEVERTLIEFAFNYTNNNKVHTAQLLGINRNTLYKRLTLYNIR